VDNRAAAEMAVRHLVDLGHTKIACIINAARPYTSASQRLEGYKQALEQALLGYNEYLVREADFDIKSGFLQMNSLLDSSEEFTAVFVASDNVAVGAYAALRDAGLSVPGDISVVGFDDIPLTPFMEPPLTTIRMPAREIAQQSYHLLMRLMKRDYPQNPEVLLPTDLVLRQSTRSLID
jgi:DNA-binding LacI/PurR family transcriptional regulator